MEKPSETRTLFEDRTDPKRVISVYRHDQTGKFSGATVWENDKSRILAHYATRKEVKDVGNDIDRIKRIISREKL